MSDRPAWTTDVDIVAQTLAALLTNLQGPTGGYTVEVTSDHSLQQQPYSRRAQTLIWLNKSLSAGARNTITNSINFYNPLVTIYSSAAATFTVEHLFNGRYYAYQTETLAAGERRVFHLRDANGLMVRHWAWGNFYLTASAATTVDFTVSHLP